MKVDERLDRLERELALMRRSNRLLVAGTCMAALLFMSLGMSGGNLPLRGAQQTRSVIRAERFELVDSSGKLRGELGVSKADTVGFLLYNEKKEPRFGLTAFKAGTHLIIYDGKKARAGLAVDKAGSRIALHDEQGERIWIAPR